MLLLVSRWAPLVFVHAGLLVLIPRYAVSAPGLINSTFASAALL